VADAENKEESEVLKKQLEKAGDEIKSKFSGVRIFKKIADLKVKANLKIK
jgi:hypothetical protein